MKKIAILGSTGSIGRNTLEVIHNLKEDFKVTALAAKSNIELLEQQAKIFQPELIAVWQEDKAVALQKCLPHIPVLSGMEGVIAVATHSNVDLVVSAMYGFAGVLPTLYAIKAKKNIALANKEVLVAAGQIVMDLVEEYQVDLIPMDSEHTAIFQCLKGEKKEEIARVILTASGGPFRDYSKESLSKASLKEALKHPNYRMGSKVTIDSSTLMNKGLEVIETKFLCGVDTDQIEVVIHPEQIIHSMVEFVDGSIMAQMGEPDMKGPIQVALTHPERKPSPTPFFDFTRSFSLNFTPWDTERFRCLSLAYEALKEGGSMLCFMSAVNEELVYRFLKEEIHWIDISQRLQTLMEKHQTYVPKHFEELLDIDQQARQLAQRI